MFHDEQWTPSVAPALSFYFALTSSTKTPTSPEHVSPCSLRKHVNLVIACSIFISKQSLAIKRDCSANRHLLGMGKQKQIKQKSLPFYHQMPKDMGAVLETGKPGLRKLFMGPKPL